MRAKAAVAVLAVSTVVSLALVGPLRAADQTVVVIPSKYAVVQFAFDVASLKPVSLVAYDVPKRSTVPVLFLWDAGVRQWIKIDTQEFIAGAVFTTPPSRVIVVGKDAVAASLAQVAAPLGKVSTIESLSVMDLANGFDAALHFSGSQWKWLARRHSLQIEDRNWERRRYGKYGKPGSEPAMPPKADKPEILIPKADPIVIPVAAPAKAQMTMDLEPAELPEAKAPAEVKAAAADKPAPAKPEDK